MDALILNAGHSQLEEQLKIAAACGVAERQHGSKSSDITAVITMEDNDEMAAVEDNNEGFWLIQFSKRACNITIAYDIVNE